MTTATRIRPGQYFYTSWGYDQTNIDYLVVKSVSPSGKTVKCLMASAINLGESGQQDVIMPGTAQGEPFQMKATSGYASGDSFNLRGSYPFCGGSKRFGYFSPVKLGDVHYETNSMFGH